MIYLGIDPGLDGAVAVMSGASVVSIHDTPTATMNRRDYLINEMAYRIASSYTLNTEVFAVLEAVHSMPKQGVASSFSFGRGLGIWEGILSALAVPYVKVAPQTWKKVMMADAPHDNKDASRIIASRLFPQMEGYFTRKKDHNRAEALLMAEYGRRLKRQ